MLQVGPDEALVIARRLAESDHHRDVASRLRALLKTERLPDRRFRAACALARLDPYDWDQWSDEVARWLVKEPEATALKWALLLRGVRFTIIQSLGKLIPVESDRPESERSLAAVLVLHRLSGTNEVPLDRQLHYTLEAEDRPYAILSPIVLAGGRDAAALVERELDKPSPADP